MAAEQHRRLASSVDPSPPAAESAAIDDPGRRRPIAAARRRPRPRRLVRRHAGGLRPRAASGRAGRARRRLLRPQAQPRNPQRGRAPRPRHRHRDRAGRRRRGVRLGGRASVPRQPRRCGGRNSADRDPGRPAQPLRACRRGRPALADGGLGAGRDAVRHIVGRDPASLDAHGVARAAIESLAENFSDGVVAPVFWYLVLGLPGLFAYKMANTLDSMIGHRTPHYRAFGWAAARLDDLANLVPAPAQRPADRRRGAVRPRRPPGARARDHAARRAEAPLAECRLARGRRWPARSASRSPGRGAMPKASLPTRGSATARARATPGRHRPRARRLQARLPDRMGSRRRSLARRSLRPLQSRAVQRSRGGRAAASSAARSRLCSRWSASASSVAST